MGLTPRRAELQSTEMSSGLHTGLWNVFSAWILKRGISTSNNLLKRGLGENPTQTEPWFLAYLDAIWQDFLKRPLDEIPRTESAVRAFFKTEVMQGASTSVYDLIDYTTHFFSDDELDKALNQVLERDLSAYRIINHHVSPIMSELEISSIESALKESEVFPGVHTHLENAFSKVSDRQHPDYRNSIKESISAVEGICKIIAKDKNATLASALDKVAEKTELHPALKQSFEKLYGYTNDADGIRHALMDSTDYPLRTPIISL